MASQPPPSTARIPFRELCGSTYWSIVTVIICFLSLLVMAIGILLLISAPDVPVSCPEGCLEVDCKGYACTCPVQCLIEPCQPQCVLTRPKGIQFIVGMFFVIVSPIICGLQIMAWLLCAERNVLQQRESRSVQGYELVGPSLSH